MTDVRLTRIREADGDGDGDNPPRRESVTDPASLTGLVEKVRGAWRSAHPYTEGEDDWWIQDVYDSYVIAEYAGETWRADYTVSAAGAITFGEPAKVSTTVTYTPTATAAAEAVDPPGEATRIHEAAITADAILEAIDDDGWIWRTTLIRPGISHNRRRYRPEVLAEAAHLYEGVKAFDGHRSDETRRSSPIGGVVGWHENVTAAADGSLQSDFHIAESAPHIRQLFKSAWAAGRADLIGLSHDASAFTNKVTEAGRTIEDVLKIAKVWSVDLVAEPSAGGRMERLVAGGEQQTNGENVDPREFLRRLRAGDLTEAQIAEAIAANPALKALLEAFEATPDAFTEPAPAAPAAAGEAGAAPVTEAGIDPTLRRVVFEQLATEAKLPEKAAARLREALETFTTTEALEAKVRETAEIWAELAAASPTPLPGQQHGVTVTEAEQDKRQKALDGMVRGETVEGQRPFRSLHEAYAAFTGDQGRGWLDTEDHNRRILASIIGCASTPDARLTESMDTSTWTQALGDSIRRSLIREYNLPALSSWRQIVSGIVPRNDFRTNRLIRVGGYGTLPTVAEGAPYQPLTSPTDEEATYAISKKGGTEDYTLEMVANDDLRALQRIPKALGRAAALTLYTAIWIDVVAGNPVIYDGSNLFDASAHSNTATGAGLAEATIGARRQAMVQQTPYGNSEDWLGAMPRFLVVPADLYTTAFKLTKSGVSVVGSGDPDTGAPNPWAGLEPIEVPLFTDANDWFLVADPASVPTIEVGFYRGMEDPELFVQDQPTVGSVFTADVFTWKIRHIWGLALEDYRGFQRGQG